MNLALISLLALFLFSPCNTLCTRCFVLVLFFFFFFFLYPQSCACLLPMRSRRLLLSSSPSSGHSNHVGTAVTSFCLFTSCHSSMSWIWSQSAPLGAIQEPNSGVMQVLGVCLGASVQN
ncbi:uncharacterized protein IWZ02DRAFT_259637 [Phyllosticta citriasiana]|uniref:uncharacterized protein n=1 Tax=Phyllosticta citriasiana TaxID=595635 RepID=UPI0030FDA6DA